jgi:glycoside/pentoside/hexuronide:cation symporter, GPH family
MRTWRKIGYGAGDFGISVSYFVVGFFFMFYLTDIAGISPFLAGTIILVGRVWEGICNLLVGTINDRTVSRFGRKRVYVLFGAIPFAICFILLWMTPGTLNDWLKFVLAIASLMLYTTAYSFISVPYMALVPAISSDYDERTQIVGYRAMLSTIGIVLGGGAALLVSSFSDQALGLRTMSIAFAAFTALSLLIAAYSVKGLEKDCKKDMTPFRTRLSQYLAITREKHVLVLLIFKFLGAIATGCLMAAIPYFATHILSESGLSTYGVAIYTVLAAALIPVWYRLTNRFDKRRLLLIANCAGSAVLLATALLVNEGNTLFFFIGCGLLGIIMSAYLLIPYSLVSDLVDYYRYKNKTTHESAYFGVWMTVHQLGIAAAGFILGTFLSLSGYEGSSAVQSPSALLAVRLAFGLIPSLFLIISAVILQKYGITRKVYQDARAKLEQEASLSELEL